MRRVPEPAFVRFFLCLYPCMVRAQSTNAPLTGRITDPSNAVVAGMRVAAVNARTNFRYETATNERANMPCQISRQALTAWRSQKKDSRT